MGWFDGLVKSAVLKWLAQQLGITPQFLATILDDVIQFVKDILENLSPQDQIVFFQKAHMAMRQSSPLLVKRVLADLQGLAKKP